VDKPKDLAVCDARPGIHLHGPTTLALDKLIAKSGGKPASAIGAFAVGDNNLSPRRSLAQMLKKWPHQRRLIENGNDY
jgi:hypothetical protein